MSLHPPCGPENRGSRVFARLRRILALSQRRNPWLHPGSRLREEGVIRRGYTFSLINPLGLTTTYAYSYGKLVTTTDPLGRETHYSYDSVGRMIRVTDALGGEVSYTYDADGNRIGTTDQRANETLTSVDALSRVTSVTYPDDAIAKRSYDAVGNLVRTTDPLGNETLFVYDAAGRQTARVDPEGERTEYEYDAAGNRTAVVRAAGTGLEVRDEYSYDTLGRLIEVTRAINTADEVTVTYGYDANGNLTSITNGRGYPWTFEYDAMNRLVAEIDPLARTRDYAYDLAGQLVEKRDPKSQKIQYDYDDGGRVSEARYIRADDTTENIARMAYDAVGNMVEVTDTNVDISQTFDDLNRITLIRHEHLDKTQRQGWDAVGNRTWMSVDEIASSTASYTWDSRNQLTQIDHDTMGTVTYTYNAAGQKITMVLPNDIDCDYTYDDNGRLTNLDYRKPDTTQVFFEDLTYDGRGNITRRVDDEGTHDYQYDDLDQLTRADYPDATYEQFAYDEAGNRSSVTTTGGTADYTVDIADQLTQIDGPGASEITTFSWTDNGEMASRDADNFRESYEWSVQSQLTAAHMGPTTSHTIEYGFNPNYRPYSTQPTLSVKSTSFSTRTILWDLRSHGWVQDSIRMRGFGMDVPRRCINTVFSLVAPEAMNFTSSLSIRCS